MEFRAETRYHRDASFQPRLPFGEGGRMSYWRWLLFAVMARLEAPEDRYLRVRNAKTIRRTVALKFDTVPQFNTIDQAMHASGESSVKHAGRNNRSARGKFVFWLLRIWRRRSQTR